MIVRVIDVHVNKQSMEEFKRITVRVPRGSAIVHEFPGGMFR